jgi:hypothetical protein
LFRILKGLQYFARSFARMPVLALPLLFTIALGIGSNVSIRGFVQGLTKPVFALTYDERLVSVFEQSPLRETGPLSYQEYLSLKNRHDVFEWIGAARVSPRVMALASQGETVSAAAVTSNLAGVLNVSLCGGVVVSHRMWQNEFGAMAGVRDVPIQIDGFN